MFLRMGLETLFILAMEWVIDNSAMILTAAIGIAFILTFIY